MKDHSVYQICIQFYITITSIGMILQKLPMRQDHYLRLIKHKIQKPDKTLPALKYEDINTK